MNIAQAQQEIEKLRKQREEIYSKLITPIEWELEKHRKFIKDNCQHHEDFLLVEEDHPEDEYGRNWSSWDKYIVTCSVCDKRVTVSKEKFRKTECSFQTLMLADSRFIEELK